ncbi:MAG: AmiS/UreI family transporter [Cellulosilyticum sp.]|nr:AmiS/UreI family transporter [Cellulosilyticum sp.]
MLGVNLLFVGIVLISNGACKLTNIDPKSTSVINLFVGVLSLYSNFVNLAQGNYYAAGTGLLFGFTYLFIDIDLLFNLDTKAFAWFSTFVAINAVIFGTMEGFLGDQFLNITGDIRWAFIWYAWAILWGTAFVEDILGKKLGKFTPILQIFEGIFTAWIPGVLMLIGKW